MDDLGSELVSLSRDPRTVAVCCIVTAQVAENRLAAGPQGPKRISCEKDQLATVFFVSAILT